jgi:hypothetical protein
MKQGEGNTTLISSMSLGEVLRLNPVFFPVVAQHMYGMGSWARGNSVRLKLIHPGIAQAIDSGNGILTYSLRLEEAWVTLVAMVVSFSTDWCPEPS